MTFTFHVLTKELLQRQIEIFVAMNHANLRNEYWGEEHFLADLNMKWSLSFYAMSPQNNMAGFLIASEKPDTVHIHKYVVDRPYQQKGLGSKMLAHLLAQTSKPISLKVEMDNAKAMEFYLKKGFVIIGSQNNLHTMIYAR